MFILQLHPNTEPSPFYRRWPLLGLAALSIVLLAAAAVIWLVGTTPAGAQDGYEPDQNLIDDVRGYAQETEKGHDHVLRWMRVLHTFDALDDVTAAEAQDYADNGWQRWDPVADALAQLEDAPGDYQPDEQLVSDVRGYARETEKGYDHVLRWMRVLHTFDALDDVTAAEAQRYADNGWQRWEPVAAELAQLEAAAATIPAVAAVAVASDPGDDNTYAPNDLIRIRLTYSETVEVSGTPRLQIDLDPAHGGEVWANYESGSGTASLSFTHTVAEPDTSTQGVAVLRDTLELNGGAIRSAAAQTDAALSHQGLEHDGAHQVDTAAPALAAAAVDGATLTASFSEPLDEGLAVAGRAFTVTARLGAAPERTIAGTGAATVAGAVVTVTLAGAVQRGDTLTVAYAPSGDGPVRDLAGNAATAFSGETVTNETPAIEPGAPRLLLTAATVRDATLTLLFNDRLHWYSVPKTSAFSVKVNGSEVNLGGRRPVAVSTTTVILTLAEAVSADDAVTVSYTGDWWNPIQSLIDHNFNYRYADDFTDLPVNNIMEDSSAPSLAGAVVNGAALTLTFDELLDPNAEPHASVFSVTVNGSAASLRTYSLTTNGRPKPPLQDPVPSIIGPSIMLTLTTSVGDGDAVAVEYAPPASGLKLQDLVGNAVVAFASTNVENRTEYEPDQQLIADVWRYATENGQGYDHVLRWVRTLKAFGALTDMTAAEAQVYTDAGLERWNPVAEELRNLENAPGNYKPDQQVIADVRSYAQETEIGFIFVLLWMRTLKTFGVLEDMTAAEAQGYADNGWPRWEPVADALAKMEASAAEPNRAPVVNTQAEHYAGFIGRNNAPRGLLVSKPFHGIFSDPDGDKLTYSVSVPADQLRLVDEVLIPTEEQMEQSGHPIEVIQRVFFRGEAEADWKAITPPVPDRPVVTATLTATDPGGLSASVSGDFLIGWDSYPEVVSATASKQAIELTFDLAVEDDPAPRPGQFTVHVVNGDGTAATVAVSSVSVNGKVMTLGLASELSTGQTITVDYAYTYSYENPVDTPLQRKDGSRAAPGFTGQAVAVNPPQPSGQPQTTAQGYRGQLAEVLVELSQRRPTQRLRREGPSAQSSHTTSIVYVIDDSGSMDGDFPEVRTALRRVRGETMDNTKVALIAFGTDATTVFGLTDHSSDATTGPWTDARINVFGGKRGGTFYSQPLENAKALLDADTDATVTTKKIIFLTDAQASWPADIVQAIIDAGIIVETIGFGDHYSDNFSVIEKIATDTGGKYQAVPKPSQGTTNDPEVTKTALSDILTGKVADNTATLFLVDNSFSVYWQNETVLHPALTAAADKAAETSGTARQVGLAIFLGETTLFESAEATPKVQKYQVVNSVGSSTLSMADGDFYITGSTDIGHALSQAYSTLSGATATNKRVVLITDGISPVDIPAATLNSYKNDTATTLDVVAWGEHADRVQLKTWADSASGTFSVAKAGPAAPKGFTAWVGDATLVMKWTAPDPADSAITKYQYRHWLHHDPKDAENTHRMSEWMDIPGSGAATTFHIFTGVPNTYPFSYLQIRAARGDDLPGTPTFSRFTGPPRQDYGIGLQATAGNEQIALSWTKPEGSITKYQYAQSEEDGAWSDWMDISSDGNTTSHTIIGLTNGATYNIAVRAERSDAGSLLSSVTATPSN